MPRTNVRSTKRTSTRRSSSSRRRAYTNSARGVSSSSKSSTRTARRTNANTPRTREELKYLDLPGLSLATGTDVAVVNDGSSGPVQLLNGVANGATAVTREGKQCYWKSVEVSGFIKPDGAASDNQRNDLYIFWDHQPGVNVPAKTDFFAGATPVAGSPHNLDYRERFVTLAHITIPMSQTAAGVSGGESSKPFNIYKKINYRTTFKGDTAALGSISTGAMYLVAMGTATAAADCVFVGSARLRFSER